MKFDNKQFGSASALLTMVQQDAIAQVVCVAAELRIEWVSFSREQRPTSVRCNHFDLTAN